jgi:hypothetical protein
MTNYDPRDRRVLLEDDVRANDMRTTDVRDRDGFGWGIPAAVLAAILIIGGLFYMNSGDHRTSTATNNTTTTQSSPAPAGAPVPGPTTTTPAPTK